MEDNAISFDLSGRLLIAMPGMGDPRFEKSVIFMCAHSDDGAMGLVVNKPASDIRFDDLLEQLGIDARGDGQAPVIHFGGPVEHGRGFVLHTADYSSRNATLRVNQAFGMTATLDVLEDIARGHGPRDCLLALGYAGWAPGQIEAEIQQNGWLVGEASPTLVFSHDSTGKWGAALQGLGIEPLSLSPTAGRA
ncbi:MAG: YqgE/AlgH family protein [Qingshengfaniella sp.]